MQNVCLAVLALWLRTAYTHTNYRSVLFCFAWQIAILYMWRQKITSIRFLIDGEL